MRRKLMKGSLMSSYFTRIVPLLIPALLLVYAVARFVDGRDGEHGGSLAWDVGHVAFLGAFIGFGVLTLALRRWLMGPRRRIAVEAAALASLIGVVLFCWVILTDLSSSLDNRASLPEPVMQVGPLVFIVGFVGLLVLAAISSAKVSFLTPLLALLALILVGADLDLLAGTAVLLLVALWPLTTFPHPTVAGPEA